MVKTIYWIQHIKKNRNKQNCRQRWKSVVQINEQLMKQNKCNTHKEQKRLLKMYIKTMVYVTENIWQ